MDKRYDHSHHEAKIYSLWEQSRSFDPDSQPRKPKNSKQATFCIMMPPPNANDPLHIGHAMFVAIEDILIRYHRMLGDDTLWLPGTDHAGIETQFVYEKKLKKEGKSRFNFDRQTLYQQIRDFVQKNSDITVNQIKKLGASADWSRFKFMLDKELVDEVLTTFEKLHQSKDNQGRPLVYRDLKLVNYCTNCGTSYSELEVIHQERHDPIYTMQYGPLRVATVRPETIFGDVALAVHPNDERYQQYIGQEVEVEFPWSSFKILVIADDHVKTDFGTGVLKITPYHDTNDWEIWQRHLDKLPKPKQVINNHGKMMDVPKQYLNLSVEQARKQVLLDLKQSGLYDPTTNKQEYLHAVGSCYRCGKTIEPLPLPQFFIRVKPLTQPILEALDKKEITIYGAGYDKILRHWLENLRDWNISRQIVWGITIPAWYPVEGNEGKISVSYLDPQDKTQQHQAILHQSLKKHSLEEIRRGLQQIYVLEGVSHVISRQEPQDGKQYLPETDTFDTWFSSAQWPFTTLKNTKKGDFERFYPTQVMETGYDILPFWVMRMLMVGKFMTGKLPFDRIYLHGLIRDQKGQKMSKSKGNVVNPLEITEKYGADALRMALVIRSSAGLDKSVGEADFKAMRNLTNKLWNAARFILLNQSNSPNTEVKGNDPSQDQSFRKQLTTLTKEVTANLDKMQIGLAAETLYNQFWHWYCDRCIEEFKQGNLSQESLLLGLKAFLKLLHPFIPFVTEAIWQQLVNHQLEPESLLITSRWPSN